MFLVSSASVVGFSGSRSPSSESVSAVRAAVGAVAPSSSVFVGCARGVDAAVRSLVPSARVFSVADVGFSGRGAFAARSVACVDAVAAAGGVWVSFPASPCPVGLVPSSRSSRCFSGGGSGTWASLAYAVGLGVPCCVFLPSGVECPSGWPLGWSAGSWFVFVPPARQLSLF